MKAMRALYTIGHSTREMGEFIALLQECKITQLVDIRTIPKSRHNPQYSQEELRKSLAEIDIDYIYMQNLGGLRPATRPSMNSAWRNTSFRNYADYMQTDEFRHGVEELVQLAAQKITAIMCAEAVPWRCHRSLVSDALLARDVPVCEIISKNNIRPHRMTSFAVVNGTEVTYPKADID